MYDTPSRLVVCTPKKPQNFIDKICSRAHKECHNLRVSLDDNCQSKVDMVRAATSE